jgi:HTH-type transcriptional regulator, quorum sensing regulator NprR
MQLPHPHEVEVKSVDEQSAIRETMIRDTPAQRLGQRLRRARLSRNLTQGEVAKNLFSVSYVSAVERGQIRPSLGALEKLAERLQVPVTDLLSTSELQLPSSFGQQEARESYSERQREELEARLRDAQRLARSGTSQEVSQAADTLLRVTGQQLAQRDLAHVNQHLAAIYAILGRGEDARRAAQDGVTLADRLGDHDLAERMRVLLGDAYSLVGSHALAAEQYRRSIHAAEQGTVKDPTAHLRALYGLGEAYRNLGQADEARQTLLNAAELARDVVNPARLAPAYWAASAARASAGDVAESRAYAYRSLATYEEIASRRLISSVYEQLGRMHQEAGQFDEAAGYLRTAHELAAGQQDARGMGSAQRQLAALYLQQKRLDDAAQAADEALEHAIRLDDATARAQALLTVAHVREEQKRYKDAERSYSEAVELLQSAGAGEPLSAAYAEFSHFLERRGESQRAFQMLKEAYSAAARHP